MVSGAAGGRFSAAALLASAGPDLRNDEVAQPDRREDAERDPLDAVGQERPGVQVRQADHAEAAGLVLDQLQIGPRSAARRAARRPVRVLIAYTCCAPSWRNGALPCGAVSESRSRAMIVTVPVGARRDGGHPGALLGFHVAAVDQHRRAAVDDERHQHLEGGVALDHPQPRQHLAGRADSARWPSPAATAHRVPTNPVAAERVVTGTGSAVSEPRDLRVLAGGLGVLAQLPRRQHGEAQVGERDHHDEQGEPARPQQEGPSASSDSRQFPSAGELLVHPVVQARQRGLDDGEDVLEVVVVP